MLLLTRHNAESIIIGDDISIKILKIEGNHVVLGITAPRSISVHREEVYLAIKNENTNSSAVPLNAISSLNEILKKNAK